MENMKINGQYGKRNPLFMYQGTAGYSIRAALDAGVRTDKGTQVFTAVSSQSGERRCGAL